MKRLPFAERPTWQRVKDISEANMAARSTISNLLHFVDEKIVTIPEVMVGHLRDAVAQLDDASGRNEAQ